MGKAKQKNKSNKSGNKPTALDTRAKKDTSVFRVAGSKVAKNKNSAKLVTTTLKKLEKKSQTDTRTEKVDAAFHDVRAKMIDTQMGTAQGKTKAIDKPCSDDTTACPDMEAAASHFAKL